MCWTRYGTPTIGWRDGDRSALISGEEPAAPSPQGMPHPNRRADAEVAMRSSQTSTLTTVDFKHATPLSARGIKICADFDVRGEFLSWSATFYIAPRFFEMTGCVRRVEGEADSQTVVRSIGQAMNARFG